jgi:hypothetical protein
MDDTQNTQAPQDMNDVQTAPVQEETVAATDAVPAEATPSAEETQA